MTNFRNITTSEMAVGGIGDSKKLIITSEATSVDSYALKVLGTSTANVALLGTDETTNNYKVGSSLNSTAAHHFYRNLGSGATAAPIVFIENDNANDDQSALKIQQDAPSSAVFIDQNGIINPALTIDQDSNHANDSYAIAITCDNAGSGAAGGIDLGTFSADEPLLKVPADAVSSAGTLTHQLAIDVGGTTYYLYAYTTGS